MNKNGTLLVIEFETSLFLQQTDDYWRRSIRFLKSISALNKDLSLFLFISYSMF